MARRTADPSAASAEAQNPGKLHSSRLQENVEKEAKAGRKKRCGLPAEIGTAGQLEAANLRAHPAGQIAAGEQRGQPATHCPGAVSKAALFGATS